MKILTIDYCDNIAHAKGGKCKSRTYVNYLAKMEWECAMKHTWWASYGNISQGTWCPKCEKNSRKPHIKECDSFAKTKDGRCKSKVYTDSRTKMEWECFSKHTWYATFNSIKNGTWCPYCVGHGRRTFDEYKVFAQSKGGVCIFAGNTTHDNAKWKCSKGHIWSATPYSVLHKNTWCPECSNNNVKEKLLGQYLSELLPQQTVLHSFNSFGWQKTNKNGRIHFDYYIPGLKMAIERDGEQHFHAIEHFGGKKGFKKRQYLDRLKNKRVKEHPEDIKVFIRIPYTEPITKDNILHILTKNGIQTLVSISV
ncbi:MAG: hypothetical protein WC523_04110 [Patescibacteria group bacterium]